MHTGAFSIGPTCNSMRLAGSEKFLGARDSRSHVGMFGHVTPIVGPRNQPVPRCFSAVRCRARLERLKLLRQRSLPTPVALHGAQSGACRRALRARAISAG